MRKKIVAGNWKMNLNLQEGERLAREIVEMLSDGKHQAETILAPPFTHLSAVKNIIGESENIFLSSQDIHPKKSGAFTGEISATMLTSAGCKYSIVGHSERRKYFNETNELLAAKIKTAMANRLTSIYCVGESLRERKANRTFEIIRKQIKEALYSFNRGEIRKVIIAYEPLWAIGTGKTATTDQAQKVHAFIRELLDMHWGYKVSKAVPILYGGSVKPGNAKELFSCQDIDGGLVGGASLRARDFVEIVKAFD